MRYLCLVYSEESLLNAMPDSNCLAYDESIRQSGHRLASEALQPVHTVTTVRVRDGKVSITDEPLLKPQNLSPVIP